MFSESDFLNTLYQLHSSRTSRLMELFEEINQDKINLRLVIYPFHLTCSLNNIKTIVELERGNLF